jgi:hypothetical protein
VIEALVEIGRAPSSAWQSLLHQRFAGDLDLVRQGLLWLAAGADRRPALDDDRYELISQLDSGATATVWLARDRVLARTVAIKVFHDHASEAVGRVIAEARAASDVISDHVVRIFDAHHGTRSYIVMELVGEHAASGELVAGRAASEDRPHGFREAARWVMQVARGVHDAHLRNVFHRDLNPRNVLITPSSRRARIADFGLAASEHACIDPGSLRGTPEYISPEQARGAPPEGRAQLVAADIWGLGAIAYDLLAGRPPWPGRGLDAWEHAVAGPAPAPLDRAIPRALRRIVEKALSIDPAARYGSAAEVGDELAAFLASRPTTFEQTHVRRAWLWTRRNPQVALTGVVAMFLMLLVLGALATLAHLRDDRETLRAELADQSAERDRIAESVRATRTELTATESSLDARNRELATLEKSLADERESYLAILHAKEHALQQATAETRLLLGRLDDLQGDRALEEATRKLYEGFWTSARRDVDRVQAERDAARTELAALKAQLATLQAEVERLRAAAATDPDGTIAPAAPTIEAN